MNADRTTRNATQADLDALSAETVRASLKPYLVEIEAGETSLICVDGVVHHVVHKVPARGDFRTQEHHGAEVRAVTPTTAQLAFAEAALEVPVSLPLYARVDLVDSQDGPLLMELELIEPTLHLSTDLATAGAPRRSDHPGDRIARGRRRTTTGCSRHVPQLRHPVAGPARGSA